MPKDRGKVHPFLAAVPADRAVKQVVNAGISLVQKGDEIVFHHCLGLGIQPLLPVQRFQLHTNCVHRSILAQFRPIVESVAGNLPGVRFVCFHFAQGVIPVVFNEFLIDRT